VPFLLPPLAVAETVTVVCEVTALLTRVKLTLLLPAVASTLDGIEATAEPPLTIASVTVASDASGRLKLTVPVLLAPPTILAGEKVNELGEFGFTVNPAFLLLPFSVAEIVTPVDTVTALVVTVKEAEALPFGIVTLGGSDFTAELPLTTANATLMLPTAGTESVTVPTVLAPPVNFPGVKRNRVMTFGFTVKVPVAEPLFAVAEIFTVVEVLTGKVPTWNVPDILPAGIVMLDGRDPIAEPPLTTASDTTVL